MPQDGHLRRRGHDRRVAQAARRLGRGRRDDRRRDHRQGRRRDPLARQPGGWRGSLVEPGETVAVGEPIAEIDAGAEAGRGASRGATGAAAAGAHPTRRERRGRTAPASTRRSCGGSPTSTAIDLDAGRGHRDRRAGAQEGRARLRRATGHGAEAAQPVAAHRVARTGPTSRQPADGADGDGARAARADVADAPGDRAAHGREPAHGGALHDDRRGRHVAGRRARASCKRGDGAARRDAHLPRLRRPGDGRGAERVPGPQRVDRRRRDRLPRRRQPRDRGRARRRADRAGDPEGPAAQPRGPGGGDRRRRRAGALEAPRARRRPRRHVHDHQPGPVRRGARDADHQPAAGGDPRPRGDRQAAGGGRGRRTATRSRSGR